jgi:opacity protein-like surface antigen
MFRQRSVFTCLVVFFFMLLTAAGPAHAEWYAGAEATNLKYKLEFTGFHEYYDLGPVRAYGGYLWDTVGIEFQAYTNESDGIIDISGDPFTLDIENTYGLFIRATTPNKVWYGLVGVIRTTTNYTDVLAPKTVSDDLLLWGLTVGMQYEVVSNLSVTLNYSYYEGKTNLAGIAYSGPGYTTRIDSKVSGVGIGLNYRF